MENSSKLPPINTNNVHQSNNNNSTNSVMNHKSLSVLKKARKQAEEDAKHLANGIALLKQVKIQNFFEKKREKFKEEYEMEMKDEEKTKT